MAEIIQTYMPMTGIENKKIINNDFLLQEYIQDTKISLVAPYILIVNEKPISRKHWDSLIIKKNDIVIFVAFPLGGGDGGSNPVATVLSIALAAGAMMIPGMQLFGAGLAGTFMSGMLGGAVMLGGSMLINKAFPPEPLQQEGIGGLSSRQGTSSSIYDLNDRGNTSALNAIIPVQYGRMKRYPHYAMQSWSQFEQNNKYAYLLFCQGQGEFDFESFNFDTVPSTDLSYAQIRTFSNNENVRLAINGEDWTHRTPDLSTTHTFRGICSKANLLVLVGSFGEIQTSPDAITWTHRTADNGFTDFFYDVDSTAGGYIAVGENGEIQTSPDTATWTKETPADSYTGDFNGVVGGIFPIAVGDNGEIQQSVGGTWTHRAADNSYTGTFKSIISGNNVYLAVGWEGEIQTSDLNAITWTHRTADNGYGGGYLDAFWGAEYSNDLNIFVIVGSNGEIQTCEDGEGITWTHRSNADGFTGTFTGITWADGMFTIVGDTGKIQTSLDGINWITQSNANNFTGDFYCVEATSDILCLAGITGEIQTCTSGKTFYDNVFTSNQVDNISVRRVDEYKVESNPLTTLTVESGDIAETDYLGNLYFSPQAKWYVWKVNEVLKIREPDGTIYTTEIVNIADGDPSYIGYIVSPSLTANYTFPIGTVMSNSFLTFITGTVGTIPFTNGVYGVADSFDGFIAGDTIIIDDPLSSYNARFVIKSSYYYTDGTVTTEDLIEYVAYEFIETVPSGADLSTQTTMTFVPGSDSIGYIVPNTNSSIQKIQFDIVLPNGLYGTNLTNGELENLTVNFKLQYKLIAENGTESSSWLDTGTQTITAAQKNPIAKTYEVTGIPVTAKKIRARVNRIFGTASDYADSQKGQSEMVFTDLKAFLTNTGTYGDVTVVAVKVKTTDSLVNASLSKFNTVSTRKLPIYDGAMWSDPVATSSIAWAAADACRNSEYSVAISDTELNADELLAMDTIWSSRGDYCNGVFESKEVFWESLKKIMRVGRAQPLLVAGSIDFVRDQPKTIPKQVFTINNIEANSFNVDYINFDNDTPDSVEFEYLDDDEWVFKQTLQTITGGTTDRPAKIQRWGITQEAHAIREAKYEAACNAYRRKLPSFITELEGRILSRLDYISISNPRIGYGLSGVVLGVNGNEIELSETVTFESGDHYIAFRKKDGTQDTPYLVTEVTGEPKKVLMSVTPPSFIYTGYEMEKTYFQFGKGADYDKKCLVETMQPQQSTKVKLMCIVDDERVYTADGTTGI